MTSNYYGAIKAIHANLAFFVNLIAKKVNLEQIEKKSSKYEKILSNSQRSIPTSRPIVGD